jgi:uncharacterized protein YndB with AHSA1/START domain
MTLAQDLALRSIVVERALPFPPEKVWKALTRAELVSRWLMPTDFRLEAGATFTFTTRPMGDWDGVVRCEVQEVRPCELLRYSWAGGPSRSRLDTVVTWTITPAGEGSHVRMEHTGFRPEDEPAYAAMSPGWTRVVERLDQSIAADEAGIPFEPAPPCEA